MLNRAQGNLFLSSQRKHLRRAVLSCCCSETSPPTPISAPSMNNYNDRQLEWQHVLQALLSQTRSITVSASRWVGGLRECNVRDANNKEERWGVGEWAEKGGKQGGWIEEVVCEPKRAERTKTEAEIEGNKQAVCTRCPPSQPLHFEAQTHVIVQTTTRECTSIMSC